MARYTGAADTERLAAAVTRERRIRDLRWFALDMIRRLAESRQRLETELTAVATPERLNRWMQQ